MLKIDEIKNPRSCLNKADVEEPIFVLRANDELAPSAVEFWADMYEHLKKRRPDGMTPEQKAKHAEALKLATQMREWKKVNG